MSSELAREDGPSPTAIQTLNFKATVANHEGCNGADETISQKCEANTKFYNIDLLKPF